MHCMHCLCGPLHCQKERRGRSPPPSSTCLVDVVRLAINIPGYKFPAVPSCAVQVSLAAAPEERPDPNPPNLHRGRLPRGSGVMGGAAPPTKERAVWGSFSHDPDAVRGPSAPRDLIISNGPTAIYIACTARVVRYVMQGKKEPAEAGSVSGTERVRPDPSLSGLP